MRINLPKFKDLVKVCMIAVMFVAFTAQNASAEVANIEEKVDEAFYWVGGSGVWSDFFNHWSDESGGDSKEFGKIPDAGDTVFVDNNSFIADQDTLIIDVKDESECFTLDFSGADKFVIFRVKDEFRVYGSLRLKKEMQVSFADGVQFKSISQGNIVDTYGHFLGNIAFDGKGGEWLFESDVYCQAWTHRYGTIRTQGVPVNCLTFSSGNATADSLALYLSDSKITIRKNTASFTALNYYVDAGSSELIFTYSHPTLFPNLYGNEHHLYNITGANTESGVIIYNGTYNKVTFLGDGYTNQIETDTLVYSPGHAYTLVGENLVNEHIQARGNTCQPIYINSSVTDTLRKVGGEVVCDFLTLTDVNVEGATFYAGAYTKSLGTNNGWIFDDAPQYTYGLGPDTVLCKGDRLETYNFNGGRSYLWHDGSTESYHEIDESGIYWVEVTYGDDCVYTDSAYIYVISNALIDAGDDIYVCEAGTPGKVDADIKPESGGYDLRWIPEDDIDFPTSSKIKITAPETREYILEISSPNGCVARDTVKYIVIESFKPMIHKEGYYLVSNSERYNQWYLEGEKIEGATEQKYMPLRTGKYSVKIVNDECESETSQVVYFSEKDYGIPVLSVLDAAGLAGDTVNIKVYLLNSSALKTAGIETIDVNLKYNSTLLMPLDSTLAMVKDSVTSYLEIQGLDALSEPDVPVYSFDCLVGLGNVKSCVLDLSEAVMTGGDTQLGLLDGIFTLKDVCEDGGDRLVNPGHSGIKSISPNPAGYWMTVEVELIEQAHTEINIYNLAGKYITTIFSEDVENTGIRAITEDTSLWMNGIYIVSLETPTYFQTKFLMIIK